MLHLTSEEMNDLSNFVWDRTNDGEYETIFNDHYFVKEKDFGLHGIQDEKRLQWVLKEDDDKDKLHPLFKKVENVLQYILPGLEPVHPAILWSLPGGQPQSLHPDFTSFNFPKLAAIYSIDDNTTLDIITVNNQRETVRILKNELLVFRGDVDHGGSAYKVDNRRIYFKILPTGAQFTQVELESTGAKLKCKHCGKNVEGMKMRTHYRGYCLAKNTKEEIEEYRERERKRSEINYKKKERKS